MFATGIPSDLFDDEAISLRGDLWSDWADALAGSTSCSLSFDLGPPGESPSSPYATLTFLLESPGSSVCFGLPMGELRAGKAGLSGFDEAASRAYAAERGFIGQAPEERWVAEAGRIKGLPPGTSSDTEQGIQKVVSNLRQTGEAPRGFYQHPDIEGPRVFLNRPPVPGGPRPLPEKPFGYYNEWDIYRYTGDPASRGIERIVTGTGGEIYYTPNHYATFYLIEVL